MVNEPHRTGPHHFLWCSEIPASRGLLTLVGVEVGLLAKRGGVSVLAVRRCGHSGADQGQDGGGRGNGGQHSGISKARDGEDRVRFESYRSVLCHPEITIGEGVYRICAFRDLGIFATVKHRLRAFFCPTS